MAQTAMSKIHVIYRTSSGSYQKLKPAYINAEKCLKNAIEVFNPLSAKYTWYIIADSVDPVKLQEATYPFDIETLHVTVGHGAGTFNLALDYALQLPETDAVYFLENDYTHLQKAGQVLEEGLNLGASFVTLYDHPDKYLDPSKGGNPYCQGGAEDTRVYLTANSHWKLTNSTTMTFATTVKTLKRVEPILRKHTRETYPQDFEMFIELRQAGESLISSIPGFSTHGETLWLSPLVDWSQI
jgi:hypothetical protein